jgi:ribonuclease T1
VCSSASIVAALLVGVMLSLAAWFPGDAGRTDGPRSTSGPPSAGHDGTLAAGSTSEPRVVSESLAAWPGGRIAAEDLPAAALRAPLLIADGGPFPYDQDGATFQDREGIVDWCVYDTDLHDDSFRFVTG